MSSLGMGVLKELQRLPLRHGPALHRHYARSARIPQPLARIHKVSCIQGSLAEGDE
jgi:hypothetical protein